MENAAAWAAKPVLMTKNAINLNSESIFSPSSMPDRLAEGDRASE